MAETTDLVKSIAKVVVMLVFVAGIIIIVVPIFQGVGWKSTYALGTEYNASWNSSQLVLSNTASTTNSVFTFLPWLGVGLVIASAFGITQLM